MMRDLKGHLFAILSGVAMLIVGVSLLFSVLGLRAGIANFSTVVTGLITSAYFAGYVAGVFFCPASLPWPVLPRPCRFFTLFG